MDQTTCKKQSSLEVQPTGIPLFDTILKGGIPLGHNILLSGYAGTGKTIFALQWLFNGYKQYEQPGLYFTFTEPLAKVMGHVQDMEFFDKSLLNPVQIHITDLGFLFKMLHLEEKRIMRDNIDNIIDLISNMIKEMHAKRLVIDSITAMCYILRDKDLIRYFIFKLGAVLTTLECTTFMTSEISGTTMSMFNVEEFIADGLIYLEHIFNRRGSQRRLKILKMRGKDFDTGLHYYTISNSGIKLINAYKPKLDYTITSDKITTGISGLDKMCEGGIFKSSFTLVAGATGTGKTIMSNQFLLNGLQHGRSCLYVSFDESHDQILRNASIFGWDFQQYETNGQLEFLCKFPEEMFLEEYLDRIISTIDRKKITKCVIDSISGAGLVFPEEDFRDFIKKIVSALKERNVTTFITTLSSTFIGSTTMKDSTLFSLTDNIFLLNYVEVEGELCHVISIIKTRGSHHDKKLRKYAITSNGIVIGEELTSFEGTITGSSKRIAASFYDQMRDEFIRSLGTEGLNIYNDLKKKGLTNDTIKHAVQNLVEKGLLSQDDADSFLHRCFHLYTHYQLKHT